jgi:hypothetical protein
LGEDFLEKYWDYKKNKINPWEISKCSDKIKVWIKCQEREYHGSYQARCSDFIKNNRCPYCCSSQGKIHFLDSLGTLYPKSLEVWSNKNKKSPYEYAPFSGEKVWWKCMDGKHEDYKRSISGSNSCDFRCPECQYSQSENSISLYLVKNKVEYISQKEFEGLIGLGGGNLSYDFYLPKYNLLIEAQGQFHDGNGDKGNYYMKQNLNKQKEHDRRKHKYAQNNNINLLEIWYWDFDRIEEILEDKLNILEKRNALQNSKAI